VRVASHLSNVPWMGDGSFDREPNRAAFLRDLYNGSIAGRLGFESVGQEQQAWCSATRKAQEEKKTGFPIHVEFLITLPQNASSIRSLGQPSVNVLASQDNEIRSFASLAKLLAEGEELGERGWSSSPGGTEPQGGSAPPTAPVGVPRSGGPRTLPPKKMARGA